VPLYDYLVSGQGTGQWVTNNENKRLKARLGDVLMKEWTLVGIPAVIAAVNALGMAEILGDNEHKPTSKEELLELPDRRKNVDFNKFILERGTGFLERLYRDDHLPIFESWGTYAQDFGWMERSVIYGLFLSDHEILSAVETELVIVTAIMCQGIPGPTIWHLRGLRRLDVSEDDTEKVQQAIEKVAIWAGKSVEGWVRVKDVQAFDHLF